MEEVVTLIQVLHIRDFIPKRSPVFSLFVAYISRLLLVFHKQIEKNLMQRRIFLFPK